MRNQKFKISHSVLGGMGLVLIEYGILQLLWTAVGMRDWWILLCAAVGSIAAMYVAIEVIEEVRNAVHMLVMLSIVIFELVFFFTLQYWFLLMSQPASFPTLLAHPITLALHSVMVFAFNPIYLPVTPEAQGLVLINTLVSLVLVLFILQNIGQFRHQKAE